MKEKRTGTFLYNQKIYEYTLLKSKRKSVSISVGKDTKILIRAPLFFSERAVEELIKNRAGWISEKYEQAKKLQGFKPSHSFASGEVFSYRGKELILNRIINPQRNRILVTKQADTLLLVSPTDEKEVLKEAIVKWYRERAKEVLPQKVSYYQKYVGRSVGDIRIKEQKSRWGSCSNKGNLNFNWKIMMAPDEIIDYLVVHELCHRLHMNHSQEFWNSVGKIIPDYKQREKWLKEKGMQLDIS